MKNFYKNNTTYILDNILIKLYIKTFIFNSNQINELCLPILFDYITIIIKFILIENVHKNLDKILNIIPNIKDIFDCK